MLGDNTLSLWVLTSVHCLGVTVVQIDEQLIIVKFSLMDTTYEFFLSLVCMVVFSRTVVGSYGVLWFI